MRGWISAKYTPSNSPGVLAFWVAANGDLHDMIICSGSRTIRNPLVLLKPNSCSDFASLMRRISILMRLIWEVAKLSFQRQLAYRSAHLAGLITNLFFGLLRAAVLIALYGAREEVSGLSLQMAITFTGLSQWDSSISGWQRTSDVLLPPS
jgi:hypothetical protein